MLFAEGQTDANLITVGTIAVSLLGILAWVLKVAFPAMLKQHRDDIMSLHADCAKEREEIQERHDKETATRAAIFQESINKIVDRLDRGVCRHDPQPGDSGILRVKKGGQ